MSGEAAAAGEGSVAARIGRYRIAFELASGGMATMFLARAEGPGGFEKLAALKRIHPHLARDQQFIEMFFDEARIASRIAHPNVCSVFDFGEADGAYYIAMDYVHGETLGRVLKRLASKPELLRAPEWPYLAARILAEAAEGLHAAHELKDDKGGLLGVVHRDVSPQNLFVAYDGTVRVVDFGVAQAEGRLHQTQAGTVKGKLAYLAPEQARRKPIDRRVDVWALGVVLWETLVAKRLFQRGTDAETILASATDDVPAPSSVRAWVPKELDAIVLKALSRDRDARYATARDLARELHRFVAHAPEPVTSHEVAAWMAQEFASEKAERERWIEQSRTAHFASPPRVAPTDISGADVEEFDPEVDLVAEDASKILPVGDAERTTQTPALTQAAFAELLPSGVRAAPALEPTPAPQGSPPLAGVPAMQEFSIPSAAVAAEQLARAARTREPSFTETRRAKRSRVGRPLAAVLTVVGLAALVGLGLAWMRPPAPSDAAPSPVAASTPPALRVAAPGPLEAPIAAPLVVRPPVVVQPVTAPPVVAAPPALVAPPVIAAPVVPSPSPQAPAQGTARRVVPAPVERAPRGTGTVAIATPGGWADVYFGDRQLGRAPGQVVVPSGRTTLRLMPFGHEPAQRVTVQVDVGGTARVVVPLSH